MTKQDDSPMFEDPLNPDDEIIFDGLFTNSGRDSDDFPVTGEMPDGIVLSDYSTPVPQDDTNEEPDSFETTDFAHRVREFSMIILWILIFGTFITLICSVVIFPIKVDYYCGDVSHSPIKGRLNQVVSLDDKGYYVEVAECQGSINNCSLNWCLIVNNRTDAYGVYNLHIRCTPLEDIHIGEEIITYYTDEMVADKLVSRCQLDHKPARYYSDRCLATFSIFGAIVILICICSSIHYYGCDGITHNFAEDE